MTRHNQDLSALAPRGGKKRDPGNEVGFGDANRPRSIYQNFNIAPRLSGQNCKIFKFLLFLNCQKRLGCNENIEVCSQSLGDKIFVSLPLSLLCLQRSLNIFFLIRNHDGSGKAILWNPALASSLVDIDEISETEIFEHTVSKEIIYSTEQDDLSLPIAILRKRTSAKKLVRAL